MRGETGRLLRSAEDLEIPGRVAPARSGLPPRGASDLERSELLCGRDELLLEDGLPLEGRPDEGLPLDERPDVEPPLEGRDDGRDPLDVGRRDSISRLHSEWHTFISVLNYNYK